jgi:hypothetical protein
MTSGMAGMPLMIGYGNQPQQQMPMQGMQQGQAGFYGQ